MPRQRKQNAITVRQLRDAELWDEFQQMLYVHYHHPDAPISFIVLDSNGEVLLYDGDPEEINKIAHVLTAKATVRGRTVNCHDRDEALKLLQGQFPGLTVE